LNNKIVNDNIARLALNSLVKSRLDLHQLHLVEAKTAVLLVVHELFVNLVFRTYPVPILSVLGQVLTVVVVVEDPVAGSEEART
jgi:hypothetical protein